MFLASEPIYWVGDVPGFRNKTEDATWLQATTEAADRCALTGERVEILGRDGKFLVARPGAAPEGTITIGSYAESDDGSPLAKIFDRRGAGMLPPCQDHSCRCTPSALSTSRVPESILAVVARGSIVAGSDRLILGG